MVLLEASLIRGWSNWRVVLLEGVFLEGGCIYYKRIVLIEGDVVSGTSL